MREVEFGITAATVGPATLYLAPAEMCYRGWPTPTCIVVDGPYGIGGFPGDPRTPDGLPEWYRPHIEVWSELAAPSTTLWFWGTEIGWATVHPVLAEHDWVYRTCHIWDKGVGHIAGNANSITLRKLPVVSEVCVQYVREPRLPSPSGELLTLKDWVRSEWVRSGIPLYRSNEACGVKNAATRKYLTADHLWYFPPPEMFERMAAFANAHGDPAGRPYFSGDGKQPIPREEWALMRAKFNCPIGLTNVWREPPVRGRERLKNGYKCVHTNQKPLSLLEDIIELCTDTGDVVWDPFAGVASVGVAAVRTGRRYYGAEILPEFFRLGVERLQEAQEEHADAALRLA